jgi:MoaA/NifB/PqqE/SkfB family radical SAM enzyme
MKYSELKNNIIREASKTNTPVLGEFELTSRCNFNCKMCYVHQETKELTTEEWKILFEEAVNQGLMFALLTGGEAMLRNDFVELYEYLFDLGVKITVFSNGSIISEEIIKAFSKRPPELVAMTIYGATAKTYKKIARKTSGLERLTEGIEKLQEHYINISLRTLPLRDIYLELDDIISFAKERNIILSYVNYLANDNNEFIDQNRLNPDELIDFQNRIKEAFHLSEAEQIACEDCTYDCAALTSGYYINHIGEMQPCALAYTPKKSVLNEDFLSVFHSLGKEMKRLNNKKTCKKCKLHSDCPICYAKRLYETEKGCNAYLKEYALKKRELS